MTLYYIHQCSLHIRLHGDCLGNLFIRDQKLRATFLAEGKDRIFHGTLVDEASRARQSSQYFLRYPLPPRKPRFLQLIYTDGHSGKPISGKKDQQQN